MAARNEEKRQTELQKKRMYQPVRRDQNFGAQHLGRLRSTTGQQPSRQSAQNTNVGKHCYSCGKLGHLAKDCRARSTESRVPSTSRTSGKNPVNRHVSTSNSTNGDDSANPVEYLYSDSEEEQDVRMIQIADKGSHSQYAEVFIQGIPAEGLIDSGAEITIMGGELFKKVATVNKLKKKDFKKSDKIPKTYSRPLLLMDEWSWTFLLEKRQ